MSRRWLEKLRGDRVVVIDGGMGTELQRRGAAMDPSTWSGMAVATRPDLVRELHRDYIRAGAEVIITNTYGCSRQMMQGAVDAERIPGIIASAVELARQARDEVGEDVAIAGSISAEPQGFESGGFLPGDRERDAYREIAEILTKAGCDLIALEMMTEPVHCPLAIEAALETGLPVWLGASCRLAEDRKTLTAYSEPRVAWEKTLDRLLDPRVAMVNIMHTGVEAIDAAIDTLRARWDGPIGVYPESGYFRHPEWQFVDLIAPEDLAAAAEGWIAKGARLVGGCCGTGPEHVRALAPLST